MTRLYKSPEFRLTWDNDIAFHVAENAVNLRKFRKKSQAQIAGAMGTSQSAVARIEAGDDNITLGKLRRLVGALEGRIRFSIEPKEISLPRWPEWWTLIDSGLGTNATWDFRVAEERLVGSERQVAAGWSDEGSVEENTMPDRALVSLGKAS